MPQSRMTDPGPTLWRCPRCGGRNVQGTAWVDLNTGKPTTDEPPTADEWCEDCEANIDVCYVVESAGQCLAHDRPFHDCYKEAAP